MIYVLCCLQRKIKEQNKIRKGQDFFGITPMCISKLELMFYITKRKTTEKPKQQQQNTKIE